MTRTLKGLVRVIRYLLAKDVKLSRKILFLIPVIYLLMPFDLIGDFFPLVGQLDDVAVFVLMWPILKGLLSRYYGDGQTGSRNRDRKKNRDAFDIDKQDYEVE